MDATVFEYRRVLEEKQQRYEELRQKYPQDCENAMLLGDLAYTYGLVTASLVHYKEALPCGASRDLLAEGIRSSISGDTEWTQAERQGLEEVAGSRSLGLDLAIALLSHRQFLAVLKMTEDLRGFRQEDGCRARRLRVMALSGLGRFDEAEQEARRLIAMAASEFEKQSADLTLEDVRSASQRVEENDFETPLQERLLRKYPKAEGWLVRLDCLQSGARMHILTADGRNLRLSAANPNEVATEGMKSLELHCGPQKRRVLVAYEPEGASAREIQGKIRYFRLLFDE